MSGSAFPSATSHRLADAFGFGVNVATLAEAVDVAIARAAQGKGFTFHTLNLDHVAKLRSSPAFRAAYRRATFVCADGWPIVWLANRAIGRRAYERAAGADIVEPLMKAAARRGLPVYLIGPGAGAQANAIAALTQRAPGLQIAGAESPELTIAHIPSERQAIAARVRDSGAPLCLVSLGAPKQELLADALASLCPSIGFVCVGAALDFIGGGARRAPAWMRGHGLEWVWRLVREPRRLAARYLASAHALLLLGLGLAVVPREEEK